MTTIEIYEEKKSKNNRFSCDSVETAIEDDLTENSTCPTALETLLEKGFSKSDIELLQKAGIHTVECVAFTPNKNITSIRGISEQKCEKLKIAAKEIVPMGFCSGFEVYEARQNLIRFTTGSSNLDKLLQGGLETGCITEISGEYRTGKSQLCHMLAVTCQLPLDLNGANGKCLWIDTEGTFRPERIIQIAERFEMETTQVLKNIVFAKAYNTDHLLSLLIDSTGIMSHSRFSLLVLDSIISLYRSEFNGRSELACRQMHLGRVLRLLQKLTDTFGVAVLITNQVMAKVDGMLGSDKCPTGGHVLAHACHTRLFLKKGKGNSRTCKITYSPNIPEQETNFVISELGINDEE